LFGHRVTCLSFEGRRSGGSSFVLSCKVSGYNLGVRTHNGKSIAIAHCDVLKSNTRTFLQVVTTSSHVHKSTQMQVFTTSSGAGSDTTEQGLGVVEDKMPPKMRKRWIHQSADALRMEVDDSGELSLRGCCGVMEE